VTVTVALGSPLDSQMSLHSSVPREKLNALSESPVALAVKLPETGEKGILKKPIPFFAKPK
jgi:hypothetical protein